MELVIKPFNELTTKELYDIYYLRTAVFVVEQECPYQEVDELDLISIHVYLQDSLGQIQAYLRFFDKQDESYVIQIGRVVTKERRKGYGKKLMEATLSYLQEKEPSKNLYLEAQVYAIPFYETFGFEVTSEEFLEDGIPHKQMRLKR